MPNSRPGARDRFAEAVARGSLPRLPIRLLSDLPEASEDTRSALVVVGGDLGTDADVLYICLRNADGTHDWVQVVAGAP
jgi:hypothetical protein